MKIGVLTGGGDCPGLNPAIRAVVRRADSYGWDTVGFLNGWAGLLGEGNARPLTPADVSGILPLGGHDARHLADQPDEEARAHGTGHQPTSGATASTRWSRSAATTRFGRLEAVRARPEDGRHSEDDGQRPLRDRACIGFNSAVSIVVDALDKLHTTASSHHRVIVVEVMGRDAGWVAVYGGIAGGAD